MSKAMQLFRGKILHFPHATDDPDKDVVCLHDGALVVEGKHIVAIGDYAELQPAYAHATVFDHREHWIMPGLIDSHLHFPQTEMLACYGEQLLSWLENYTFPTERKFSDPEYASTMADVFIRQLLRNGTTTGLVYPTVHANSVDALFNAASSMDMAMVTGKVCMD
ncbi:amidohydrolase family protein, partial [Alteromonas sp. 14N.309.X.WAT.G.H12]|uniref:amidohydrolase family protein n=1 Tax=Alteromonas sp. 14N.309.X.WAT.G.H12 TaxID=3120824 RepID=UPI002FD375DC